MRGGVLYFSSKAKVPSQGLNIKTDQKLGKLLESKSNVLLKDIFLILGQNNHIRKSQPTQWKGN